MIWSIILGWLLAMGAVAWGQEPAVPVGSVVTLEQAITLALHNNRQVKNAALEVDKAADRVAQAQTRRLPALEVQVLESYLLTPIDFTFKQGTFGTFPGTGPIPAKRIPPFVPNASPPPLWPPASRSRCHSSTVLG